jgi:hypothetical protein
MKLRHAASVALMMAIVCALGTLFIIAAHLLEWFVEGRMTHLTVGQILGTDSLWLQIPLCLLSPVVTFLALYLFFGTWSYAVRKDMEADAGPPPE